MSVIRHVPLWEVIDDYSNNSRRKLIQKHRCRTWRLRVANVPDLGHDVHAFAGRRGASLDYQADIKGPSEFRPDYKVERYGTKFASLAEAKDFLIGKAISNREQIIADLLRAAQEMRRDIENLRLLRGERL